MSDVIKYLKEERQSRFQEWVHGRYSREHLEENIFEANKQGFTELTINVTDVPNRSDTEKNFLKSGEFLEYLIDMFPDFDVKQERYTVLRPNFLRGKFVEVTHMHIVISWGDKG